MSKEKKIKNQLNVIMYLVSPETLKTCLPLTDVQEVTICISLHSSQSPGGQAGLGLLILFYRQRN